MRCASGRSAPAAGGVQASTRVSDRDGASAAAPGATTDSCRSGSTIVADGSAALDAAADDAPRDYADRWTAAGSGSAAAPVAAWRWTGRPTSAALDVSDATAWVGAATSPDGASGVTSCPSWPTIGGSGRAPGTSARNDPAGATTGGSPLTRWIGGSDDHAPVGGASVGGAGETGLRVSAPDRPAPPPSGRTATAGAPSRLLSQSLVDPADLVDEPQPERMLEVEDRRRSASGSGRRRTRPPRTAGRARTSRFPQALLTRHVDREPVVAGRAGDRRLGVALLVDPPVEVLEEREVGGEQALDDAGVDLGQRCRGGSRPATAAGPSGRPRSRGPAGRAAG